METGRSHVWVKYLTNFVPDYAFVGQLAPLTEIAQGMDDIDDGIEDGWRPITFIFMDGATLKTGYFGPEENNILVTRPHPGEVDTNQFQKGDWVWFDTKKEFDEWAAKIKNGTSRIS